LHCLNVFMSVASRLFECEVDFTQILVI
jgi:hypothetical protein